MAPAPLLFEAVLALCPRDDRHPNRRAHVVADERERDYADLLV